MKSVIAVHKTFSLKIRFREKDSSINDQRHKFTTISITTMTRITTMISIATNLNWIFLSGFCISGSIEQKGLTNSRNLIPILRPTTQQVVPDYL